MCRRTLVEVTEFAIIIENKLPMRRKNMAKYRQNDFDSDESDDFYKKMSIMIKKNKIKSKKIDFDTIKR